MQPAVSQGLCNESRDYITGSIEQVAGGMNKKEEKAKVT